MLQTAVESVAQVVQPWLYFNIILRNSQIFLPVLDKVPAPCRAQLWRQMWSGSSERL